MSVLERAAFHFTGQRQAELGCRWLASAPRVLRSGDATVVAEAAAVFGEHGDA